MGTTKMVIDTYFKISMLLLWRDKTNKNKNKNKKESTEPTI
jgi:hypothetical protein